MEKEDAMEKEERENRMSLTRGRSFSPDKSTSNSLSTTGRYNILHICRIFRGYLMNTLLPTRLANNFLL